MDTYLKQISSIALVLGLTVTWGNDLKVLEWRKAEEQASSSVFVAYRISKDAIYVGIKDVDGEVPSGIEAEDLRQYMENLEEQIDSWSNALAEEFYNRDGPGILSETLSYLRAKGFKDVFTYSNSGLSIIVDNLRMEVDKLDRVSQVEQIAWLINRIDSILKLDGIYSYRENFHGKSYTHELEGNGSGVIRKNIIRSGTDVVLIRLVYWDDSESYREMLESASLKLISGIMSSAPVPLSSDSAGTVFGIVYSYENRGIRVFEVLEGSRAAEYGLMAGDLIVDIGGIDFNSLEGINLTEIINDQFVDSITIIRSENLLKLSRYKKINNK